MLKFQNHLCHQGEVEQSCCPLASGEPTIPQHWSWKRPCTVVSKAQTRFHLAPNQSFKELLGNSSDSSLVS